MCSTRVRGKCVESSSAWEGRIQSSNLVKEWNDHFASVLYTILSWQMVTALLAIPVLPVGVKEGRISFTYLHRSLPCYVSASKANSLRVLLWAGKVKNQGTTRSDNLPKDIQETWQQKSDLPRHLQCFACILWVALLHIWDTFKPATLLGSSCDY